jgi:DnaJ homolog subfamily C member 17
MDVTAKDFPGTLDTTVKVKWTLSSRPMLTTAEDLVTLLAPFGAVESSDIVLSLKPAPPKKPKRGTALIPFKQIGDAFAAVCSSGSVSRGLQDVELSWAEGPEPGLIAWLKKMGKLGYQDLSHGPSAENPPLTTPTYTARSSNITTSAPSPTSHPFSSFPSTFVGLLECCSV